MYTFHRRIFIVFIIVIFRILADFIAIIINVLLRIFNEIPMCGGALDRIAIDKVKLWMRM